MSSSMLEQAVVDAQELKEAAIKNAEQEVLEKYSGEIKEAVNTLLEQDVDPMVDPLAAEGTTQIDSVVENIPLKALDGTGINETEDGDEIELDLDALIRTVASDVDAEQLMVDPMALSSVDAAATPEMMLEATEAELQELLDQEEIEEGIGSTITKGVGAGVGGLAGAALGGPVGSAIGSAAGGKLASNATRDDEDEDLELDEESLKAAIAEILTVDFKNVPSGMTGTTHPTKQDQIRAVEVAAARDEDTEVQEENAEFDKALKKIVNLEEQVKSLKSDKNRLAKEHNELKSIARQVSDKLTELNTTNAKLVYQNRILESSSLNERQKTKLVEAVSNAKSTKEVKVIFETLQDSLSPKVQVAPQTLSEAVSKNNRLVLKSNKKETQVSDFATERMKKLAGII